MSTGVVLVLLSPEAVSREESFQWYEVNYALERSLNFALGRPTVLPVVLRDFAETMARLPTSLQQIQALDLSSLPTQDKPDALLKVLERITTIVNA
jgi:hypothetical protein